MSEWDGELPAGWTDSPLKDLIAPDGLFNDGDWVESKDQDPNGDVRLIQLGDIGDGVFRNRSERFLTAAKAEELQCTFLRTGDVLISRLADPLGRACIFPAQPQPCVTAVDVCIFRSGRDGVDHNWLMHFINSTYFRDKIELRSSGTTRKRISRRNLGDIEMRVPPLAEQQRIVAKIEALQERSRRAREALSEVGPLLEQFRQSVLAAAFRGDLTADWRAAHPNVEPASELLHHIRTERRRRWEQAELAKYKAKGTNLPKNWQDRYKEPEPLDDSALPKLPDRWEWIRVMEIGEVRLGRQRSPKYHAGPNMRPYLRVMNVFEDRIATEDVMEMDFSPEDYERYRLEPGDILLNEGQSHELVGRSAIYCGEIPGACFTNTLVRFRPDTPLGSDYPQIVFLGYLKSGRFQRLASLTVNIAHLGAGRFAEMEFPLPPLEEQEEIVKRARGALDQIAWLEKRLRANFADLNQLDQAILAKAFRGDLVPQDPNDEPASILLERIREQRAQQAEATKARKKTAKTQPRNGTIKKSSDLASQQQPKADAQASTGQTIASEQLWFKY